MNVLTARRSRRACVAALALALPVWAVSCSEDEAKKDFAPTMPPSNGLPEGAGPKAPQPYASTWFPADLLKWSPTSDPDAPFNRGAVPLAPRTPDGTAGALVPVNGHARREAKLSSLAVFHGTSAHPSQGGWDQTNQLDVYAFSYWQYLDLMVMWGGAADEGLILAPAPYIIDASHRHGVPVLGTVFLPPGVYGGNFKWVEDLLQQDAAGHFPVADKLLEVARWAHFDGWFFNQETEGGTAATAATMRDFLEYLQAHKDPGMQMYWYDAMDRTGGVNWQGALNDSNKMFFQDNGTRVSDEVFVDFRWRSTSGSLASSRAVASASGRDPYDLFAGIDVESNGYDTAVKWSELFPEASEPVLSLGVLGASSLRWKAAPGPRATSHADFLIKESRFWTGENQNPANTTTASPGGWNGIAHYITERSPVARLPFVTHFNTGQGSFYNIEGRSGTPRTWHNLSAMDVQPTWKWIVDGGGLTPELTEKDAYHGGSALRVAGSLAASTPVRIPLFKTDVTIPEDANLRVAFRNGSANKPTYMSVLLGTSTGLAGEAIAMPIGPSTSDGWTVKTFPLGVASGKRVTSIQLSFTADQAVGDYEVLVGELVVTGGPAKAPSKPADVNVAALQYTSTTKANLRLTWAASPEPVFTYNVFQQLADGSRVFLGSTPNTAYFVNGIERPASSGSSDIVVQAIGADYAYGPESEGRAALDWTLFPPPAL